jgi:hypothetical protein
MSKKTCLHFDQDRDQDSQSSSSDSRIRIRIKITDPEETLAWLHTCISLLLCFPDSHLSTVNLMAVSDY